MAADTNGRQDIFVRLGARTERVSVATSGVEGNGGGYAPSINAGDDTVAFNSSSDNFLKHYGGSRVYIRDLKRGATMSGSVPAEVYNPDASDSGGNLDASGRYLAFVSYRAHTAIGDQRDNADIFVRDRWNFPPAPVLTGVERGPQPRSLRLVWEFAEETQTGFEVQRKIGNGPWLPLRTAPPDTRTLLDENLEYDTFYLYRLRAVNSGYASAYSSQFGETTELEPPTEFAAMVSPDGRAIHLTWKARAGSYDGFDLERQVGEGEFESPLFIAAAGRNHTDSEVIPETLFTYRLKIIRSFEESRPVVVSATTPKDPPPPIGLQASAEGREIQIRWTAIGTAVVDGVYVERRNNMGAFVRIATVSSKLGAYDDAGLDIDTEYAYRLRHFRGSAISDPSAVVTARTNAPPPAPTGLTAVLKKGVTLHWDPVPNAKSVTIKIYRRTGSTSYAVLSQQPGTATGATDPAVSGGETYFYRLKATDAVGESPFSNEVSITIPNQPPIANAGPDNTIRTRSKRARVTLDGSASSDPEGKALTFTWSEGKSQIATGMTPTVKMKPGTHTVTLTVRDSRKAAATDQVVITIKRKR